MHRHAALLDGQAAASHITPHRLPRGTQTVLPPSLKTARCRRYQRRGVSERRTRRPAVTSTRARRGLRARRAAPDARAALRGMARGADAQNLQQTERRQRGGDRAVELVPVEIPATCMLRAEYWKGTCRALTEHQRGVLQSIPSIPTAQENRATARTQAHDAASRDGAGAQDTQQVERRQRGGDRAVERVRTERPATCMVRPAVQ